MLWLVILPRLRENDARLQNACTDSRWVWRGASLLMCARGWTQPSSTRRARLFLSAVRLQMHAMGKTDVRARRPHRSPCLGHPAVHLVPDSAR